MHLTRRRLLTGIIAAPVVVTTPGLLMPVKVWATGGIVGPVDTPLVGEIPEGWLACNGQEVSRSTYRNLFAAIGETFGAGDGVETFRLPDMRPVLHSEFIVSGGKVVHQSGWTRIVDKIATADQPNGIPAGYICPTYERAQP